MVCSIALLLNTDSIPSVAFRLIHGLICKVDQLVLADWRPLMVSGYSDAYGDIHADAVNLDWRRCNFRTDCPGSNFCAIDCGIPEKNHKLVSSISGGNVAGAAGSQQILTDGAQHGI